MSGEIREARAAIAQALQGLTMNDQPVNVYSDYPRQWALPALAAGPASGDYVVQDGWAQLSELHRDRGHHAGQQCGRPGSARGYGGPGP